jgi:integrase/recombinase XerD
MTALAPALQAFFTQRLITQRNSSPETIAAYRDTWRLLLGFAREQTGKQPFQLDLDDLDAPLIGAFLTHLEHDRGNTARTRNARLAAIHSFYRFAALEHPEHAHTIARVMAIPAKRHERNILSYLDPGEIKALLDAPDPGTWLGRRDHALLVLMIQTGVRVSELTGLRNSDVHLGTGAHIRVTGKGRKKRATTLTGETVKIMRQWLTERHGQPADPLFPTRQGHPLSRYTVGALVAKHTAAAAAVSCPSLKARRVTPHTLRHIPTPCSCGPKAWTSRLSRCGWAMRAPRPRIFTRSLRNCIRRAREPRISGGWRPEIRVESPAFSGFRRGGWVK